MGDENEKRKLKMGQLAYDFASKKMVFKIGETQTEIFPIDASVTETSENAVSSKAVWTAIQSGGGSGYILPPATTSTLGGIIVGDNLTITEDGKLNATGGGTPITIDTELDKTSDNAIANKPVATKIEELENSIPDPYTLPTASAETLGGVKVGDGLSISEGVLSVTGGGSTPYVLPIASSDTLGGIKIGENLTIDEEGVVSASASGTEVEANPIDESTDTLNKIKIGEIVYNIEGGGEPYELPIASTTELGGVKIGSNLSIDTNGVLSADKQNYTALDISYDNTTTQVSYTTVQAVLDYLIQNGGGGGASAEFYTYDETMEILKGQSGGDEPDMIGGIFEEVNDMEGSAITEGGLFEEVTEDGE